MTSQTALDNAQAIVNDMRARLGNASFLYSENQFLIATSEALGNLAHYLEQIAGQDDAAYREIFDDKGHKPAAGNIAVGDTIRYRGTFGMDPLPTEAKVTDLTLTGTPRSKYGDDVTEVTAEQVRQNRVLFGLDNSHWCYAEQVITA